MKFKASLLELWKRAVTIGRTQHQIYYNGENNLYPNEVERIINNSPTAKRCALMMAKFIAGDGLAEEFPDSVVNQHKAYTISDIVRKIAQSIAYQYGAYLHVNYGIDEKGNLTIKNLDVLDYLKCRMSKEDDEQNKGKIYYKDYESIDRNFLSDYTDQRWFYPYNPNPKIVLEQIKNDFELDQKQKKMHKEFTLEEGIKLYRGQIYYLNLSPYIYSLSPVDSVLNDADSEYRFSLYTNNQMRSGFVGKTIILTNGLDDEKNEEIEEQVAQFLGAENSGNVWLVQLDQQTENIENTLKVMQVPAQFDDALFTENNNRIKKNILGAFNNIPEALVFSGEGSLFSVNDQTYLQMKKFYSEQTAQERRAIEETLTNLGFPCLIKPIGTDDLP